ncbi:MAG: diguanylate cyclase [Treponema sp.]|nr:diguanylate cyclase [Treponema sp.]
MKQENLIDISSVKNTKFQMIIWFSTTATLLIIILSTLIIRQTNNILKIKVAELEKELNIQACSNMNNHITQVENASEYLRIMTEDLNSIISKGNLSTEEKATKLFEVTSFLRNFSFIRNYSDMVVIYSDGYYAGKLAQNSYNPELLYSYINAKLENRNYSKTWRSGDFNDFSKIYFAKKIHTDAIFICSMETSKLEDFICSPSTLNMKTLLVNPENQIIYSSDPKDIGEEIPSGLLSVFKNKKNLHIFRKYLVTMSMCSNGWKLITTASLTEVLKERRMLITYVIILSVFAVTVILIFSIVFSLKLTIPIERLIDSLHNQATKDKLTKLANEITFAENASKIIECVQEKTLGIFFIDVDHFTSIIDIQGRNQSDKIIFDIADSIRRAFPKEAVIGRLGSDRFGVCTEISKSADSNKSAQTYCELLQQELFTKFQGDFDVTLSIGIALYPDHGKSFNLLLDMSERAMNTVKKTTRNNWRIFDPATDIHSYKK